MENGIYRGRAVSAVLGETSKGNEQVGIYFEFLDDNVAGQHLTYYGTFTERAMEFTLKALRNAGWKGEDLSDLSSVGGVEAPEVSLVVENEEYEGKWTSKIKWVNAPGGLAMKSQLSTDKAKAFAAKMRGAVIAYDKSNGTPRPAPKPAGRQPEPPPHTDSDRPPV